MKAILWNCHYSNIWEQSHSNIDAPMSLKLLLREDWYSAYSAFLMDVPFRSVFGMPSAHSEYVLVEMETFHFQTIRPKQTVFTLVFCFCFPLLILISLTQTAAAKLSAVHKGAKSFHMLHTSFRAVFSFTSFLVSLQICLWCHWADSDIWSTISMWNNFSTNWPQWLVCWIPRDQNVTHPRSVLSFYTLDGYSKVVLEPNFLKVDSTPDLSHLGTRLHPTQVARDKDDKSF